MLTRCKNLTKCFLHQNNYFFHLFKILGAHGHDATAPLRSRSPLNQLEGLGSAVSSPSGVRGRAPAEKEFGALQSREKATVRGSHIEHSDEHVLQ